MLDDRLLHRWVLTRFDDEPEGYEFGVQIRPNMPISVACDELWQERCIRLGHADVRAKEPGPKHADLTPGWAHLQWRSYDASIHDGWREYVITDARTGEVIAPTATPQQIDADRHINVRLQRKEA
jgi:hypothetical protein